jgi:predicted dehydrogenase
MVAETVLEGLADPVRFVVLGPGKMADTIMPDFRLVDGVEVVAVAGRSPKKTRAFAERWNIPAAIELEHSRQVDADIVYIATSPAHHMAAAMLAFEWGMGALVEKAFSRSSAEAQPVIEAARRDDRFLMEAMWMRFNPHIRAAVAAVAAGEIGEPRVLTAAFGRPVPYDPPHRLWNAEQGGGTLLDHTVYPLALADLFFGQPESVQVIGTTTGYHGEDRRVVTEAAVLLGYPSGAQAVSTTSIRAKLVPAAVLSGSAGAIVFDEPFWSANGFTIRSASGAVRRVDTVRDGAGWAPMLRGVRDAYQRGLTEHPLSPMAATMRVMGVLDEIEAQITGQAIARPRATPPPPAAAPGTR